MRVASYEGRPVRGERWRGLGRNGARTETRRVIDRTLGSDVMFQAGRRTAFNPPEVATYEDWMTWQNTAKQLAEGKS